MNNPAINFESSIIGLERSQPIAGPGFLEGLNGGVMNPGAISSGIGTLILAKGLFCPWLNAPQGWELVGPPILITLDETGELTSCAILRETNFPVISQYSDYRLFAFRGEYFATHSWTGARGRHDISRLILEEERLEFLGCPSVDFPTRQYEKNWVYFEEGGELYCIYSFLPYRLLRLVDHRLLRFESVACRQPVQQPSGTLGTEIIRSAWPSMGLPKEPAEISNSTNPILYDKDHLFFVVHKYAWPENAPYRIYLQWGVLLERRSMMPVAVTSIPIFSGKNARGVLPGVVYTNSVVLRGDVLNFFNGEGDSQIALAAVEKRELEPYWIELACF